MARVVLSVTVLAFIAGHDASCQIHILHEGGLLIVLLLLAGTWIEPQSHLPLVLRMIADALDRKGRLNMLEGSVERSVWS